MSEFIRDYIDIVLTQREWSWAIVSVVYFATILIIRSWFLKPLITRAKKLDKKNFHEIKSNYLSRCAIGWFFLLASTAAVSFAWHQGISLPLDIREAGIVLGAFISAILAIFFHLIAFGLASLNALKKTEESQSLL